ncbi:MAG: hypothetical protein CM1200mP12_22640 [Gammaproteobacteria bacterium]|nr:MAG: hypothetical protein CM1200mP12_22640 [Gammaproteobacteria bacterium]
MLDSKNYEVINIDITLIAETPKIHQKNDQIIDSLSKNLEVTKSSVSCKATTTDGLGFEGEKKREKLAKLFLLLKKRTKNFL